MFARLGFALGFVWLLGSVALLTANGHPLAAYLWVGFVPAAFLYGCGAALTWIFSAFRLPSH